MLIMLSSSNGIFGIMFQWSLVFHPDRAFSVAAKFTFSTGASQRCTYIEAHWTPCTFRNKTETRGTDCLGSGWSELFVKRQKHGRVTG